MDKSLYKLPEGHYSPCTKHGRLMCVDCQYSKEETCSQCGDAITDIEAEQKQGYCRECYNNEMIGNEFGGF